MRGLTETLVYKNSHQKIKFRILHIFSVNGLFCTATFGRPVEAFTLFLPMHAH